MECENATTFEILDDNILEKTKAKTSTRRRRSFTAKNKSPRKQTTMDAFEEKLRAEMKRQQTEISFESEREALKEARKKLQQEKEQLKQRMLLEEEQTKILMEKIEANRQGGDSDEPIDPVTPSENEELLENFQDFLSKLPEKSRSQIELILQKAEIPSSTFDSQEFVCGDMKRSLSPDSRTSRRQISVHLLDRRPSEARSDLDALCDLLDQHFEYIFLEKNHLPLEVSRIKLKKDSPSVDRDYFFKWVETQRESVMELQRIVHNSLNHEAEVRLTRLFQVIELDSDLKARVENIPGLSFSDLSSVEKKVDLIQLRIALQHENGTYDLPRIREITNAIDNQQTTMNQRKNHCENQNVNFAMVSQSSINVNGKIEDHQLQEGVLTENAIREALLQGGLTNVRECGPNVSKELLDLCDLLDQYYSFLFRDEEEWASFPVKVRETFITMQESDISKVDRNLLIKTFNNLGMVLGIRKCIESILEIKFEKTFKHVYGMVALDPEMQAGLQECSWMFSDVKKEELWSLGENALEEDHLVDEDRFRALFQQSGSIDDLQTLTKICHILETRPVTAIEAPVISEEIWVCAASMMDSQTVHDTLEVFGMAESQNETDDSGDGIFELCGLLDNHYEFFPSIFAILPDEIKPIFEKIQIPKEKKINRALLAESLDAKEGMVEEIKKRVRITVIQHFDEKFYHLCDGIDLDFHGDISTQEFEWIFATEQAREFFNNFNMLGSEKLDREDFRDLFALDDGTFDICKLQQVSDLVAKKRKQLKANAVTREELREILVGFGIVSNEFGSDFTEFCNMLDEHYEFLFVHGANRLWGTFPSDLRKAFQLIQQSDVRKVNRVLIARALKQSNIKEIQPVKKRIEAFVLRKFNEQFEELCEVVEFDYDLQINLEEIRWILPNQNKFPLIRIDRNGTRKLDRIGFRAMFRLPDSTYDLQRLREVRDLMHDKLEDKQEKAKTSRQVIEEAYNKHVVREKLNNLESDRPRTRGECKGTSEYVVFFFKRMLRQMEKSSRDNEDDIKRKYEVSRHVRNMRPFLRALEKQLCDADITRKFGKLVDHCLNREHAQALELFLELSHENLVWSNQGLSKIAQRNCVSAIEELLHHCEKQHPPSETVGTRSVVRRTSVYLATLATFSD